MSTRKTTNEFVASAIKIHGNKYNYSKSNYINNRTKTEIICNIHGSFWQIPNSHIDNNRGCPECGGKKKLSTEIFISKAKKIHGGLYDYSQTKYKNSHVEVIIICKYHGKFEQLAYAHLNGHGCPKCGGTGKLNNDIFISKSKKVHGDLYDYSLINYNTNRDKVKIKYHLHGIFLQIPNDHLMGKGCPRCVHRISKPETEFLNYYNIPYDSRQKRIMTYNVDGYDSNTNTIYEFLGDYYHGNPELYKYIEYNKQCKKTFGELYRITINRFQKLKQVGYNIKYVWQFDWKKFKRGIVKFPQIKDY